jgi:hypothetical protein
MFPSALMAAAAADRQRELRQDVRRHREAAQARRDARYRRRHRA